MRNVTCGTSPRNHRCRFDDYGFGHIITRSSMTVRRVKAGNFLHFGHFVTAVCSNYQEMRRLLESFSLPSLVRFSAVDFATHRAAHSAVFGFFFLAAAAQLSP